MNEPEKIRQTLANAGTIAVIGCSPNPARPSHGVALYLLQKGYNVIPVNPGHERIFERPCYPDLDTIPAAVSLDIVDVFRASKYVGALVGPAIRRGAGFFWMQEGVIDEEAAARLEAAGIGVAMDRCILKEHRKYFSD